MKQMLIIVAAALWVIGYACGASAWIYVADKGDSGWHTCTYTAGPEGFTGIAGFVVSNVIDNSAYSELLLDNLSQANGEVGPNRGFEQGLLGYDLLGTSNACVEVLDSATSALGQVYKPTEGDFLADMRGLSTGIDTSGFHNATGQVGTVGAIMETNIILNPGEEFSFDWAFLGNDSSPWGDFALFYLKDPKRGVLISADGLAQIGSPPAKAVLPSILLLLDLEG